MAADPRQVLRILRYRDIGVRLEGGRLIARPRHGVLPDDMRSFIRHFRDLIVAELEREEVIAETVTNILSLSLEDREQYRRELRTARPDRPYITHDREAWRRAMALLEVEEGVAA